MDNKAGIHMIEGVSEIVNMYAKEYSEKASYEQVLRVIQTIQVNCPSSFGLERPLTVSCPHCLECWEMALLVKLGEMGTQPLDRKADERDFAIARLHSNGVMIEGMGGD